MVSAPAALFTDVTTYGIWLALVRQHRVLASEIQCKVCKAANLRLSVADEKWTTPVWDQCLLFISFVLLTGWPVGPLIFWKHWQEKPVGGRPMFAWKNWSLKRE